MSFDPIGMDSSEYANFVVPSQTGGLPTVEQVVPLPPPSDVPTKLTTTTSDTFLYVRTPRTVKDVWFVEEGTGFMCQCTDGSLWMVERILEFNDNHNEWDRKYEWTRIEVPQE